MFISHAYDKRVLSFFYKWLRNFWVFINNTASIPPHFGPGFISLLHERRKAPNGQGLKLGEDAYRLIVTVEVSLCFG